MITLNFVNISSVLSNPGVETEFVAEGLFVNLRLSNLVFPSGIWIDCHKAVFRNARLNNCLGITFTDATWEGFNSDLTILPNNVYNKGLFLDHCTNITLDGGKIQGRGIGLYATGGKNIRALGLTTGRGSVLNYGIEFAGVDTYEIAGCTIENVVADCINLSNCKHGRVTDSNLLGRYMMAGPHADCIQLMNACDDLLIRNVHANRRAQGVFFDGGTATSNNIKIVNCVFELDHLNGISPLSNSLGVIVQDCVVRTLPEGLVQTSIKAPSVIEFRGSTTVEAYKTAPLIVYEPKP